MTAIRYVHPSASLTRNLFATKWLCAVSHRISYSNTLSWRFRQVRATLFDDTADLNSACSFPAYKQPLGIMHTPNPAAATVPHLTLISTLVCDNTLSHL
jgi:hypothetical protein